MASDQDLVGLAEIAARLQRPSNTIVRWCERHYLFPEPVTRIHGARVWSWAQVEAWVKSTGRDKLPPYVPKSVWYDPEADEPDPEPEIVVPELLPAPVLDAVSAFDAEVWQGDPEPQIVTEPAATFHEEPSPDVAVTSPVESGWERELRLARQAEGLA